MSLSDRSVSPAELEGLLLSSPDVQDACVVGIDDERSGQRPLGFVVLSLSAQEKIKSKQTTEEHLRLSIMKVSRQGCVYGVKRVSIFEGTACCSPNVPIQTPCERPFH